MKMGFVSAILDGYTFEEVIEFASKQGFECVELACWPQGKAERRYAGVSHLDIDRVLEDDTYTRYIIDFKNKKNVEISSLAYYPNLLEADVEKRGAAAEHLKKLIKASSKLRIGMVTTFIGRDQNQTVEENKACGRRTGKDCN